MRVLLFFFTIASALAQIEHPRLGLMPDQDGAARPVQGVAGSVTLGDAMVTGVQALACSKRLCLVKTGASLVSLSGESADAPPGPALFALDGNAAFVYFERSRRLARWHEGRLDPVDFAVDGEVLALRVTDGGALEIAVARDDGVWLVHGDGTVIDSLPAGPLMLLKRAVIYSAADGEVVLRRADGTELQFGVAGAESFFALGEGYVGVRAGNLTWAIRIEPGLEQAFLLPGAAP